MIRLSVLERNHISMKCPADYNDAMQSDSEPMDDPSYTQEEENARASPASPQLSGGISRAYRKRQCQKKKQGRPASTQEVENAPPSGETSTAYRRRQRQNNNQGRIASFDEAYRLLTTKRNRITTPTPEEDDDEISRPVTDPQKNYVNTNVKSLVLYGNMSQSQVMRVKYNVIIVLNIGKVCQDQHQLH